MDETSVRDRYVMLHDSIIKIMSMPRSGDRDSEEKLKSFLTMIAQLTQGRLAAHIDHMNAREIINH